MVKVTLIKSIVAGAPVNVKTAHALGLRKIGQSNIFEDTSSIRGMIHHIKHLLKVEEVEDQPVRRKRRGKAAAAARAKAADAPAAQENTNEAP